MSTSFRARLKQKPVQILIGLVVIVGGFFAYRSWQASKTVAPQYVTAAVEKGTLSVSVGGSGQVSSANQIDLKPQVSGTVLTVAVKNGQMVKAGTLLVQLDASDAWRTLRDAQTSLETARLTLTQFLQPVDALTLLQSKNTLTQATETRQGAVDDLVKTYDDGFNAVSNAFLKLPTVIVDMDAVMKNKTSDTGQTFIDAYSDEANAIDTTTFALKNRAITSYTAARAKYDAIFSEYKNASRFQETAKTEALINEAYAMVKSLAESVKDLKNLLDFVNTTLAASGHKLPSTLAADQAKLETDIGTTNSHLGSLLSAQSSIVNNKQTITSSDRTIAERTASLAKLQASPNALDLRSQQLAVRQREDAVTDAQVNAAHYTIRAPIDAQVASVTVKKGDSVSSGTAAITLITQQQMATISLNEVDVAKVAVGQKTILTFDSVADLNLTGTVSDVQAIGTVSQGVVSYQVQIVFDTQDERIKPGMSVSANVITNVKQDILMVPNSAVKSQGQTLYVETLENGLPVRHTVQTGLSNDSSTEVTGGVTEGEEIITQTITKSAAAAPVSNSILGGFGGGAARGVTGASSGRTFRPGG